MAAMMVNICCKKLVAQMFALANYQLLLLLKDVE
jgi:hypothetical protein